jgi:hypothetical protein
MDIACEHVVRVVAVAASNGVGEESVELSRLVIMVARDRNIGSSSSSSSSISGI